MEKQAVKMRKNAKESKLFYAYISPWIIGFCLFTVIPMVFSLVMSFTNATALTLFTDKIKFNNFENFTMIFTKDPDFIKSIANTFYYTVFRNLFVIVLGLGVALLLNDVPMKRTLRTIVYLPSVIPIVGSALIWQLLFDTNSSVFNQVFMSFGLQPFEFADYDNALNSVVLMSVWTGLGPTMIIFLAAITAIPKDILEAADIDGAGKTMIFFKITLPLIIPNILFVAVTGMISSLQAYAEMDLLFGGGPGDATITMTMKVVGNMYEDSVKGFGYACAQSWFIFVIVMIFTLIFFKLNKKYMFYGENDE